ncbi:glycoside hydrolase [Chloropicon primus]|nr:glycoside hydrolase [Chloropicon primus]
MNLARRRGFPRFLLLQGLLGLLLLTGNGEGAREPRTQRTRRTPNNTNTNNTNTNTNTTHANVTTGKTKAFRITDSIRAVVSVEEDFSLCFEDADTGEEVLCTVPEGSRAGSLEAGKWVGVNLQKYFYEGYSMRIGHRVWTTRSLQVQADSISFDNEDEDGSSGTAGTLRFQVVLQQEELASVEVRRASGEFPDAVSVRVKTKVGNRLKINLVPRDAGPEARGKGSRREKLLGLGERYGFLDQRGKVVYCWAEDGGWTVGPFKRFPKGKETTYMPVPFVLSSEGHGIWLNTTRRTNWDLDSEGDGRYSLEVEGREIDMVVINGKAPARTLEVFTGMVGRALIPPEFQFGPWNNFFNEFDRDTPAEQQASKFVELDIPSSVTDYAIHFLPGGKDLDPKRLSSATAEMRSMGIAPLAYFNSMIDERYESMYQHAKERGLFVKSRWGTPWKFYYKGAGYKPFEVGLLDFTNPESRTFFASLLDNSTELGFKGFMYDYGEYVDPGMRFHDGTKGDETHNAYPVAYQSVAYDYFRSLSPSPRGEGYAPPYIFYARAGYTGTGGRTWAAWTGDPTSDWDKSTGLGAQVKAMLSAGLSGVPFIGSDIGGFVWVEPPTLELWVRWVQVGSVSGIMRMQTGGTSLLGKEKTHVHDSPLGTFIYRRYAKLRTSLFPYLYTAAHAARAKGTPLVRHHILEAWWRDEVAIEQEYQYMLGPSLLCAPVVNRGQSKQSVYLPRGAAWYDLMSHLRYDRQDGRHRLGSSELLRGGQWVTVEAPLESLPLFAKSGSAVPTLSPEVATLNEALDPRVVTLSDLGHLLHWWVFPDGDSCAEGSTWDGAGLTLYNGTTIFLHDDRKRSWVIQVAGPAGDSSRWFVPGVPRVSSWREVLESPSPSWSSDPAQRTLWLKVDTGSVDRVDLGRGGSGLEE